MKKIYKNTFILSISNILVRIIGLLFIIFFSYIVKDEGISLYTYAFIPYIFFADISTIGIIPSTSKFVSKLLNDKEYNKLTYFFVSFQKILLFIGILSFILLNIAATTYTKIELGGVIDSRVVTSIRIVSVSLIIMPLLSFYRGFFNGCLDMSTNSVSLIIEQISRVVLTLLTCYLLIRVKSVSYYYLIYLAMIGQVVSSFLSFFYLFKKKKKYLTNKKDIFKFKKMFFINALLIGILTINLSIYQMIDSLTYMSNDLSIYKSFYYKTYNFEVQRLILIPIIVSSSLATSILPSISYETDKLKIKKSMQKVLTISYYFIIFCCGFFYMYRVELYDLFYNLSQMGVQVLKNSVLLIFIYSINKIFIGINVGIGKTKILFFISIISFIIKYFLNISLIGSLSYIGLIISSFVSCSIIVVCNIVIIKKHLNILYSFHISKIFKGIISIFIASLINIAIKGLYPNIMDTKFLKLINIGVYGVLFFVISLIIYILLNYKFNDIIDTRG